MKEETKKKSGEFIIVLGSKGGTGKTTVSQNVIAPTLHRMTGEKVTLIEADDNNVSDSLESTIIDFHSFSVDGGTEKAMRELFEVYGGKKVVIDVGGGNDSKNFFNAFKGLELDEMSTFVIPVLKNKNGMKNLLDTVRMIRSFSKSKIVVVLNQVKATNQKELEHEFNYLYGDKSLNIDGIFKDICNDVVFTIVHETQVFDLAEDYKRTAYEIATANLNIKSFRDDAAKKGPDALMKALAFINIYNLCSEYKKETLDRFYTAFTAE